MRKYGNMFRAGDSPGAAVDNRVRTVDLRLLSGNTAVHSDMFMWHYEESAETAALQFLNIIFAVPQLSVRLEDIPQSHREMVTHYTAYWRRNRAVLLDGAFAAANPMANYPMVSARGDSKRIIALYADMVVSLASAVATDEIDIVNAKASRRVVIDPRVALGSYDFQALDALGRAVSSGTVSLSDGPVALEVPRSGVLQLVRVRE